MNIKKVSEQTGISADTTYVAFYAGCTKSWVVFSLVKEGKMIRSNIC